MTVIDKSEIPLIANTVFNNIELKLNIIVVDGEAVQVGNGQSSLMALIVMSK